MKKIRKHIAGIIILSLVMVMGTKTFTAETKKNGNPAYANITDMIKAEEKPESTYTSTRRKDIYNDWFESEKEAQEYVEQTRIA